MNVSSYIYGTSFYHRFDVRPKLVSTLLFCAAAFLMESYTGFMVVLVFPLAVMAASVGARETWRCWSRLLPLFLILLAFIPLQARDGYKKRDRNLISEAIRSCHAAEKALGRFRREYRSLWMAERKPFGFEVIDVRLAGVAARLETLRTTICGHLRNGGAIEELELFFPPDFSARDAGTAYASAASKSHNAIWMM